MFTHDQYREVFFYPDPTKNLLKLPVCPKCKDTKPVKVIGCSNSGPLVVSESFPWYECSECQVQWNAKYGTWDSNDPRISWYRR
jgi:transposase-like protein